MAIYAGMIENLDDNVGNLIKHLKAIGEYNNTLIVFISDNGAEATEYESISAFAKWYQKNRDNSYASIGGPGSSISQGPGWAMVSNTPLKLFKGSVAEGGLRVPCVFYWPGMIKPGMKNAFSSVIDITPTLLNVANIKSPGNEYNGRKIYPIEGISMLPYMKNKSDFVYNANQMIGFELFGNSALFQGDWKILRLRAPFGDNQWHLYNIALDPSEQVDKAQQFPKRFQQMIKGYKNYSEKVGLIPVPKDFNPYKAIQAYSEEQHN